jgi:hypothetical protein
MNKWVAASTTDVLLAPQKANVFTGETMHALTSMGLL